MKKIILLIISLLFPYSVLSDVPESQKSEVAHLLSFVESSPCSLSRNGSSHAGAKAKNHIEKKYDYFRDDIKTTEDFIRLSATKSTMSGKFYKVECPGKKTIKTRDWLLNELKRFRESSKSVLNKSIICKEPRPQICTMEYMPVCATLKNGSRKTYSTGCTACADKNVLSYRSDGCK